LDPAPRAVHLEFDDHRAFLVRDLRLSAAVGSSCRRSASGRAPAGRGAGACRRKACRGPGMERSADCSVGVFGGGWCLAAALAALAGAAGAGASPASRLSRGVRPLPAVRSGQEWRYVGAVTRTVSDPLAPGRSREERIPLVTSATILGQKEGRLQV